LDDHSDSSLVEGQAKRNGAIMETYRNEVKKMVKELEDRCKVILRTSKCSY